MKKILVTDPEKRIKIEQIKQHPFYLHGKNIFKKIHPDINEENNEDKNMEKLVDTNNNNVHHRYNQN